MKPRNPEQGAVAIVVAAALIMLFGLAALAVDVGSSYTRRLGLQAVADAAALGGARGGISTARALQIATKNGYGGAAFAATTPYGGFADRLNVKITASRPAFFSPVLGFGALNLTAQATAVATPAIPAIMALGSACGDAGSVRINNPAMIINGNVASAGGITYNSGSIETNGSATYANAGCAVGPPASTDAGSSPTGGFGLGTIASNPFATTTLADFPTCDRGTLTGSANQSFAPTIDGVYCSAGKLDLTWGASTTLKVTLVAKGQINISGTDGTLTAFANGFIAYSTAALDCPASQAINAGNSGITFKGSFYAPNGCLNLNAATMTIEGSLIAKAVQIQGGLTSTITGPSGSSAGNAYLLE